MAGARDGEWITPHERARIAGDRAKELQDRLVMIQSERGPVREHDLARSMQAAKDAAGLGRSAHRRAADAHRRAAAAHERAAQLADAMGRQEQAAEHREAGRADLDAATLDDAQADGHREDPAET